MGHSSYSTDSYTNYRTSIAKLSTHEIFKNNQVKKISASMDPFGLKVRECRDSDAHPAAIPIAIFLDETGSMGKIPETMVREKLGVLMETLIAQGLTDSSVMFSMIGDHVSDSYPLQIGQFESGDKELITWLSESYLEGGGGGGNHESYLLAWLIAANYTSTDNWEKRKQKGILITIGDERSWTEIDAPSLNRILGTSESETMTDKQLLAMAREKWNVFHIHVNQGSYEDNPIVFDYWEKLLGYPAVILHDYNLIGEVIATIAGQASGIDVNKMLTSFAPDISEGVRKSVAHYLTL